MGHMICVCSQQGSFKWTSEKSTFIITVLMSHAPKLQPHRGEQHPPPSVVKVQSLQL